MLPRQVEQQLTYLKADIRSTEYWNIWTRVPSILTSAGVIPIAASRILIWRHARNPRMLAVRGLSTPDAPGNSSLVAQRPRSVVTVIVILLAQTTVQGFQRCRSRGQVAAKNHPVLVVVLVRVVVMGCHLAGLPVVGRLLVHDHEGPGAYAVFVLDGGHKVIHRLEAARHVGCEGRVEAIDRPVVASEEFTQVWLVSNQDQTVIFQKAIEDLR